MAPSRAPNGVDSSGVCNNLSTSWKLRNRGSDRLALGVSTSCVGSAGTLPSRSRKRKNVRTATTARATLRGDRPSMRSVRENSITSARVTFESFWTSHPARKRAKIRRSDPYAASVFAASPRSTSR